MSGARVAVRRFSFATSLLLIAALFNGCSQGILERHASHIVARLQRWHTPEEVAFFMQAAADAGISTVHLVVKHDEDDVIPSGTAFYRSTIAPVWRSITTWDPLAVAIDEAHRRGLRVYAWIPQFHDQAAALAHPEWEMQIAVNGEAKPYSSMGHSYFVNPIDPSVRAYEQSIVEEVVRNYNVDGIDLDWVRFDGFNMDVGPLSRAAAQAAIGIDPLALDFASGMIDPSVAKWQVWRSGIISDHVHAVAAAVRSIRSSVHVAAFVLPQSFVEVGQNLALFADALDEVEPMCYWSDWGYSPSWVVDDCIPTVEARITKAGASTVIIPTIGASETEAQVVQVVSDLQSRYPDLSAVAWFYYNTWSAERMKESADRLKSWP